MLKKKYNILLVKRVFEQFGGAERILLSLIPRLPDDRFSIHIVLLKNRLYKDSEIEKQIFDTGCKCHTLIWDNKKDFFTVSNKLKDYCIENKIDLIHSHDSRSNLVVLLVGIYTKIPILTTIYGWVGTPWRVKLYETIDLFLHFFFKNIITISDYQKRKLFINSYIPSKKIKTIYCMAETNRYLENKISKEDAKRHWGLKSENMVIGCVARLSREKGQEYLIHVFHPLSLKYPSLRLLLAGDGYTKKNLQSLAEKLCITDKIVFTGFTNDLGLIYPAIDIYVSPSEREGGLPLSIQEAIMFKVPIAATAVGGTPELIKDNLTGYLVPSGDIDHMSERIKSFIDNPDNANRMAEEGYSYYRKIINLEDTITATKEFYRDIIEGSK